MDEIVEFKKILISIQSIIGASDKKMDKIAKLISKVAPTLDMSEARFAQSVYNVVAYETKISKKNLISELIKEI